MATANPTVNPSGAAGARQALNDLPQRKVGSLERMLGPEFYRILKGIITNPLSVFGTALIIFFAFVAIAAPVLAPPENIRNPYMILRDGFGAQPMAPGSTWTIYPPDLPFWYQPLTGLDHWVHIFGASAGGYDIWYGVVWGARTALEVGVIIEAITLLIGILIGSLAAFYGGWLDNILMRITEIFMAFPYIMAALTLSAILTPRLGKGIWPPAIAITAFGWMSYARLIRGDILSVRERDFVTAARVVGAKDNRILMRHIIPNAIYPTLVLFVLGWNLVGDALRDIMDPRMRGRGA